MAYLNLHLQPLQQKEALRKYFPTKRYRLTSNSHVISIVYVRPGTSQSIKANLGGARRSLHRVPGGKLFDANKPKACQHLQG